MARTGGRLMVDVSLDFGMLDGKPVTLRELPLT